MGSYRLDKGFLFDYTWEKSTRRLKPADFHKIFWDLFDYQKTAGSKVPDYEKKPDLDVIFSFVGPQIKSRLDGAKRTANATQTGTPPAHPPAHPPAPLREDKIREEKIREDKVREDKAHVQPLCTARGSMNNVFLSEQEYSDLIKQYGENILPVIDRLSRYMASQGKDYASHYATLLAWAEEDHIPKLGSETQLNNFEKKVTDSSLKRIKSLGLDEPCQANEQPKNNQSF